VGQGSPQVPLSYSAAGGVGLRGQLTVKERAQNNLANSPGDFESPG